MGTVSVAIIAHNEEANLERTLKSLGFADEIVVVDCRSSDRTAKIAKNMFTSMRPAVSGKLCTRPNILNLNENKNYAFDQTTGDWILCLDADEEIPPELGKEILRAADGIGAEDAYFFKRRNIYLGKWLRFGGQYPDKQLRLFRRGKGRFPAKHPHERLDVSGPVGMLKTPMLHYTYPNMREIWKKIHFKTDCEAEILFARGLKPGFFNDMKYFFWLPGIRFFRRYILKLGFLDGVPGFMACFFDVVSVVMSYGKLAAICRRKK